ncbi:hypothetical protein C495_13776 [Natronorubrum sulfidifaciens JCM 14089]|uniref:Uncharacterized protein n=1 Tax=Natronorubrum sulfidifaciens JCM 14089 TaxID=1230460 RepID=L9W1U4_9EURY|nr:hypothetical protein C495_13776 [Natronorubrum sulfidifaciens JCM 14089]
MASVGPITVSIVIAAPQDEQWVTDSSVPEPSATSICPSVFAGRDGTPADMSGGVDRNDPSVGQAGQRSRVGV